MKAHELIFALFALALLSGLGYVIYDQFIKEEKTTEAPLAAGGGSDVTTTAAPEEGETTTAAPEGGETTTAAPEGGETTTVAPGAAKGMTVKQRAGFYASLGVMFLGALTSNMIYILGSEDATLLRVFSFFMWGAGLATASVFATKFGAVVRDWGIYGGAVGLSILAFPRARILILGPAYLGFKSGKLAGRVGVKGGGMFTRFFDRISKLFIGETEFERLKSSSLFGGEFRGLKEELEAKLKEAETDAQRGSLLKEYNKKVKELRDRFREASSKKKSSTLEEEVDI